jgi:NCAIR mutase (PurE)-related protein
VIGSGHVDPLADLTRALTDPADEGAGTGRPDFGREARKGVPEVVLAETKADADLVALVGAFLERRHRAIASRVRAEQRELLPLCSDIDDVDTCRRSVCKLRAAPRTSQITPSTSRTTYRKRMFDTTFRA